MVQPNDLVDVLLRKGAVPQLDDGVFVVVGTSRE